MVFEYLEHECLITFLLHNIGCLMLFTQIDYLLHYMKVNAEWCQLRAIGSGLVVACTWQDVVSCIQNHDISSTPPRYKYAESLILSLYLYQCVLGNMRSKDPFYHAFVLIRTPVGYLNNNKTMSMLYFFCNGYPSLIDYTMFSIAHNGIVAKQTQKQISTIMNNYIRKPGAAVVASLLMHNAFRGQHHEIANNEMFYPNVLLSCLVYYKYATSRTKLSRSANTANTTKSK